MTLVISRWGSQQALSLVRFARRDRYNYVHSFDTHVSKIHTSSIPRTQALQGDKRLTPAGRISGTQSEPFQTSLRSDEPRATKAKAPNVFNSNRRTFREGLFARTRNEAQASTAGQQPALVPSVINPELPINGKLLAGSSSGERSLFKPNTRIDKPISQSILEDGRVSGLFDIHLTDNPPTDDYGSASRYDTVHALEASVYTLRQRLTASIKGRALNSFSSYREFCNAYKKDAQSLIDTPTLEIHQFLSFSPSDRHHLALETLFLLMFRPLADLYRLLPVLYKHFNLDPDLTARAVIFAYYRCAYYSVRVYLSRPFSQEHQRAFRLSPSVPLPLKFYNLLIHPHLSPIREIILSNLPRYAVLHNSPLHFRNSPAVKAWLQNDNLWERKCQEIQASLANGYDWQDALSVFNGFLPRVYNGKAISLEYLNTIHAIVLAAEKSATLDAATAHQLVLAVLDTKTHHHPFVWELMLGLASKFGSTAALNYLTPRLLQTGYLFFRSRALNQLIKAREVLEMPPLIWEGNPLLQKEIRRNAPVASLWIRSWHYYYERNAHEFAPAGYYGGAREGSHAVYSRLLPLYRAAFEPQVLEALTGNTPVNLPLAPLPTAFGPYAKLPETESALCYMLKSYLRDSGHSAQHTVALYERFRQLISVPSSLLPPLFASHVMIFFLDALRKQEHDSGNLNLCMSIVADVLRIIKHPLAAQRPYQRLEPAVPMLAKGRIWISLIQMLAVQRHFDAAERVLSEIRSHAPAAFGHAAVLLYQQYELNGNTEKAREVARRFEADGWKVTNPAENIFSPYLLKPVVRKMELKMRVAANGPCHWLPEHHRNAYV